MPPLLPSITAAIGATPLIDLQRLCSAVDGRIVAKLEYLNPGFSKKDRIARQMISDAEQQGRLQPGQTVVELTSGNTGTGLAIVCAVRGYPFVAVMSAGNSTERARMMRALGAEVVIVPQAPNARPGNVSGADLTLVEEAARRIVAERNAFRADQFTLESNSRAHYLYTAPEIWQQSDGSIDAFCDFAGSGGSFAGCARFFKEQQRPVACYLIEPAQARALAGEPVVDGRHPIQGGGYAIADLPLIERRHVNGYLSVGSDAAIAATRRLAKEEGIFAGYSAGADVAAALDLLHGPHRGATVCVLICDSGLKYLSTDLWP